jgi:hypothetical protein
LLDCNYTTICPEKLSDGTLKFPSVLKSLHTQEIDENKFIISPVREIFLTYCFFSHFSLRRYHSQASENFPVLLSTVWKAIRLVKRYWHQTPKFCVGVTCKSIFDTREFQRFSIHSLSAFL